MFHRSTLTAFLAVSCLCSTQIAAQSAQRWSIQASPLYVAVFGNAYDGMVGGIGGEMQVRVTPSLWSYGAGLQYSSHGVTDSDITIGLGGVFFEPRRVFDIGSGKYAPYLSSRLAYLSLSADIEDFGTRVASGANPELSLSVARRATATVSASGFQGNIGGGVLTKLSPRVNLDVGFTVGAIRFGQAELKSGGRTIQVSDEVTGTGQNLVVRAGLAIGLGGGKAKAPATTKPATRR